MPISSNASSLRTGVCTSTTRPSAPYNGQVIYETDTGKTQVWNSTAWVMLTNSNTPPGLEFIKTVSMSGGTTDLTSIFSSSYKTYKINLTNLAPSTTLQLQGQMLSGSTPLTTNTYETQRFYAQSTTTGGSGTAGTAIGYGNIGYVNANMGTMLTFEIDNPFASAYTTWFAQNAQNNAYIEINGTVVRNNISYDGLRINTSTGTCTGSATVYGYRNSV